MSELALKLIDKAFKEKATSLDLGNCSLRSLPEEITKLSETLEVLNFSDWYEIDGNSTKTSNSLERNSFIDNNNSFQYLLKFKKIKALWLRSCDVDISGISIISKLYSLAVLDLGFNDLGEKGAEYISGLTSLTKLDLTFCKIGEIGAKHLSNLTSLVSLDLYYNSIEEEGAKCISTLSKLTYLDIGSNQIGEKGTEHISKLSGLTYLDIRSNQIGEKGAEHISNLSFLTYLGIGNNQIGEQGAKHISKLTSLRILFIESNGIGERGVEHISKLPLLTNLSVSTNQIGPIGAQYISKISNLVDLSIQNNQIGEKGAEYISALSNLTRLLVDANQLGEKGAQYISRLLSLQSLRIGNNELGEQGAKFIGKLFSLTYLGIANNQIGDEGIAFLTKLSNLEKLIAISNNIGSDGAAQLGVLTKLKSLELQNNRIQKLPIELVNNISREINIVSENTTYEDGLYLFGNPIEYPPVEVVKQGRSSVLEYLQGKLKPLNECKLIFVGNGSVGKTSLMKRLVFGTFDKKEQTTHGINKIAWNALKNIKGEQVKVNLWDFGGQHIQHSLHQFFLTERVVYVLVLNPRNDEKAHYWLDQIEKLGRGSQIIIVYNWIDEKDKEANYLNNFYELRKIYPKLSEPILLSCATGEGMPEFEDHIRKTILSNEGLKTEYPTKWFEIKKKLEDEIPIETNYVEYSRYEEWCAERDYNEPERRKNLLKILDSVGSIVFFDRPILNQLQVLNPEWITTGAYAILTSDKTRETKGHLKWNDLKEIFAEEKEIFSDKKIKIKYTEHQFQFIIQLMLDYRLCQKSPLEDHEYLIPSAFGEKPEKNYQMVKDESRHYRLQFRSSFEMLIIHRFIAKNILHIVGKDYWNSGIYFKHSTSETYALVDTNLYSKQIDCWIKGQNIRGFWEVIRNDFREIFKMYHNFPVKEEVEYTSDNRIVFMPYQEMLDSLRNGVYIIDYHPTYQIKNIDVQNVLELFESPEQTKRIMTDERISIEINPEIIVKSEVNNYATEIKQLNSPQMKPNNPWISGSFYLVVFIVIMTTIAVMSSYIHWALIPIVLIAGILFIGIIGAFQLRNDQKLKEENFLKLMSETYKRLPLLRSKQK